MDERLDAKLEKYFKKAKPLFEDLELGDTEGFEPKAAGRKIMEMALSYYKDAVHFNSKGEHVNALAALEYAEGWLDAGRYTGLIKDKNSGRDLL